jgi:multidrug resistance efflux pump
MVDPPESKGDAVDPPESKGDEAVTPVAAGTSDPPVRKRTGSFKRWRARFVVLVMLAGASFGGLKLAHARSVEAARLDIGTVTLTAEAIPVQSLLAGQVTSVSVHAQQHVNTGQQLGKIATTIATGSGKIVHNTVALTAPTAGIVTDDPIAVGNTLQPGQAFVVLYDPADLTLVANVPLTELRHLSTGMPATLRAQGLPNTIHATVKRVVPRVGAANSSIAPDHVQLVLVPQNVAEVAQLIPGLRFTGTVDTRSTTRLPPGGSINLVP